jgi:O-methyltransferase
LDSEREELEGMNRFIKRPIKTVLAKFGYQIKPLPSGKPTSIHLWDGDPLFNSIYQQVLGFTLVSKQRCFIIFQFAKQVSSLPGDVAEVGVYKGGTARLLAKSFESTQKPIHLFDTFSGTPPVDPIKDSYYKEGLWGNTSIEDVRAYLTDCRNVNFYQGLFPDTAKPIQNKIFCLVHIDVDIYKSVMDCCHFFYPRSQKVGLMIFDDYGDLSCPGAKLAVDEYFSDKPENPCYLPTGQCIVIRL